MVRKIQPVDGLLADLRGEGERSEGEFTLDPRQAAEKLRLFQLADPYHYVLLLAEAAFLGGATFLQARVSSRDVALCYDGQAPDPDHLEHLFARMLTTRLPHLKVLGLGLNAALRLAPQQLAVECWDGQHGQLLQLDEDGGRFRESTACPWNQAPEGTVWRVILRHRLGWQYFKKLLNFSQRAPEAAALQAFCSFAPARVEVNGQPVRATLQTRGALLQARVQSSDPLCRLPWGTSEDCLATVRMDSPGDFEAVLVGWHDQPPERSQVELVINGVRAASRPLPNPHLYLSGTVACRTLERNLSRTDVVDDAACQKLLRQLKSLARELLTAALGQLQQRPNLEALLPWLFGLLKEHVRRKDYPQAFGKRDLRSALLDLKLFRLHDGRSIATRPLLEQYLQRGTLVVTEREWPSCELEGVLVVFVDSTVEPVLRKVFPKWESGQPLIDRVAQSQRERPDFLARPPGPQQLDMPLVARLPFPLGELGLNADPSEPWCLLLGREGRLLGPWRGPLTQFPAGLLGLAYHDALAPAPGWNGALACPARAAVVDSVLEQLPNLYRQLLTERNPVETTAAHLTHLLDYLARSGARWPLQLPDELLKHPWLPDVHAGLVALADLKPPVHFLLEPPPVPCPPLPVPTLLLSPALARVLQALMGRRAWREASLLLTPEPDPSPSPLPEEPALAELVLVGGLRGSLRLLGPGQGLTVLLIDEGRVLMQRRLDLPVPRLEARVDSGPLEPEDWPGLETRLLARLQRLVLELARRVARKRSTLKGPPEMLAPWLWSMLSWASNQDGADSSRLRDLPILPGVGGERYSLKQLQDWLAMRGSVACFARDPGAGPELGLVVEPEAEWVVQLTQGRAHWEEPEPVKRPAAPPQVLVPPPWEPGPPGLLPHLRGLLNDLEPREACRQLADRLRLGQGCGLVSWEPPDVVINFEHPWVRPLVLAAEPPLARLVLLLSASFSLLNHSTAELQDQDERRFHRSLLRRLT